MGELWEVLSRHFPQFASGFWITVQLVVAAFIIAMVVGTIVAAFRVAPLKPLQVARRFLRRDLPQRPPSDPAVILAFAGLSEQGSTSTGGSPERWALGLYTAAYVAEAIRSGSSPSARGRSTHRCRSASPIQRHSGRSSFRRPSER